MKPRTGTIDGQLVLAAVLLTLVGCAVSLSAGFAKSLNIGAGPVSREFLMQLACGIVAVPLMIGVAMVPAHKWRQWVVPILGLAIVGLVAVKVLGTEMSGAQRWVRIGPITVQPAEFAKVACFLFLSIVLAKRRPFVVPKLKRNADWAAKLDNIYLPSLKRLWPLGVLGFFIVMIEREPDLGTAAVIAAVAWIMYFIAGARPKVFVALTLIGAIGVTGMIMQESYRMERIDSHLHRWEAHHMDDIGYQTTQSEIAMASGGWVGVGPGAGRAKHMMPAATTDFALATVAEEAGFMGVLAILALTGYLVWRLTVLGLAAHTRFARYMCLSMATWFTVQATVNLMMANGTLPPIGIPYPFISSGGSSLLALWLGLGLAQSSLLETQEQEVQSHETRRNGWRNRRARLSRA